MWLLLISKEVASLENNKSRYTFLAQIVTKKSEQKEIILSYQTRNK